MRKFILAVAAIGLLLAGRVYAADTYAVDPAHSSIGFTVKHLMVSTVPGSFGQFQGSVTYDPADPNSFKADMTIQTASINTNVVKRDEHLRGPDFFDAEKFPTITFTSRSLSGSNGQYDLAGSLTIKGVTKDVSIPVTISGPVKSPMGGEAIGLSGQLVIDRQEFGVSWNKTLDNGGYMVSNDVNISINLEAGKK